jgi:hypothetical protein
MKPQSRQEAIGFWFAEDFNQRLDRVRVQVVVDEVDLLGVGIKDIDQIANRFGPFSRFCVSALAQLAIGPSSVDDRPGVDYKPKRLTGSLV